MGGVGSAATVPFEQRSRGRQFPTSGLHAGRRAVREEGRRRRGLGRSWSEKTSDGPPGRGAHPSHTTPACPQPPPPSSLFPQGTGF